MCTKPHDISVKGYIKFLDTNLGDPELFPGTNEIEKNLKEFVLKLLNSPKSAQGIIVSGGTEGNINAMWLAKKLSENVQNGLLQDKLTYLAKEEEKHKIFIEEM